MSKSRRHLRSLLLGLAAAASLGVVALALVGPERTPPPWTAPVAEPVAAEDVVPAEPAAVAPAPAIPEPPAAAFPSFRRGVNLPRVLSFSWRDPARPGKYLWPPFQGDLARISDAELDRLRGLGFDFIRLPVDVAPFLEADADKAGQLLGMMRQWVLRLRGHGLAVLLDMHPDTYESNWRPPDILADPPNGKFVRYAQFLGEVAAYFRDQPAGAFALGLMNEPQSACERKDAEDWTVSQKRLFDAVRAVAPAMPLVVTGGCWASPDGLMRLDPAAYDAATLYDFHFYEPYYFTHQSIGWAMEPVRYIAGLSWPAQSDSIEKTMSETKAYLARLEERGSPQPAGALASARKDVSDYFRKQKPDAATVAARFDDIAVWANANGVDPGRIVMGEFSAIRWPAGVHDDGSRLRWLAAVRKAAEDHGIGWALWDYFEGFGLLADNAGRTVDPGTAAALGLNLDALAP